MALLEACNVSVSVHNTILVDNINLYLEAGEVLAVIGPNGAGKTSLVRALTGDLTLQHGTIAFNNKALRDYDQQLRARQLAMLSQQTVLDFPFLAADVVHLGRIPHASSTAENNQIVTETLAAVDMLDRAQQLYPYLSGGEKQRIQLARVMAQIWRQEDSPTRLLILDEPTASLDVAHSQQLMKIVRQLADDGVAVIMIVHDFNLAARYADSIAVLKNSAIQIMGTPADVITRETMQQVFDVDASIIPHPTNGKPMVFVND